MGDGDEGGTESPTGPDKNGKGGNSGDDSGDYTEGQNKSVGQTEKDLLGPKPEVVNPPHIRTATGEHEHASTGKSGGAAGGGAHAGAGAAGG